MLPWRQLFLKALVELPEGSSWVEGAEVLLRWESRGKPPSFWSTSLGTDAEPWTNHVGACFLLDDFPSFGFLFSSKM